MDEIRESNRKLKVLIFTAHYGAGHIKVSQALKAEMAAQGIADVTIVDFFDMTAPRLNKFVISLHRETTRRAPFLYGAFYRSMDSEWINEQMQKFGHKDLLSYLKDNHPDIIICTYPTPAGVLSRMKATCEYDGFIVTVLTDYRAHAHWIHPNVDLYLVAHRELRDDVIHRGVDKNRIAVTGIPIDAKFFKSPNVKPENYNFKPDRPMVLVMAVGYTPQNALRMIEVCTALKTAAQVGIVCGRDKKLQDKITAAYGNNAQVHIFGFVEKMDEIMSLADLIVTKAGGITVTESLAKRLPMIIFRPTPGQERENTKFLVEAGAAISAGNSGELREALDLLLESADTGTAMRKAADNVISPNRGEAAKQILTHFNNSRTG